MSGVIEDIGNQEFGLNPGQYRAHQSGPNGGLFSMISSHHNGVQGIRNMGVLTEDAQRLIDSAVSRVGLERLVLIEDLLSLGLTFPVTDPMGVMEIYWDAHSEAEGVERTMSPDGQLFEGVPDVSGNRIPVYATMAGFRIGVRVLRASVRNGIPLDLSIVEQKTRRVNEGIEEAGFVGAGITVNGNTTPGIETAPGVQTFTFENNRAWDDVLKTGEGILADVQTAAAALDDINRPGPYYLYIPTDYNLVLNNDFKANSDKSIRMRLQELEFGGQNLVVRAAGKASANTVSLVQMTSDTIDLVNGQEPVAVPWGNNPWIQRVAILAFQVPRIKADSEGNTAIAVGTPS